MAKAKSFHKFSFRQIKVKGKGRKPSVGATTVLYMDGKPLKGVRDATITVEAGGFSTVTVNFICEFDRVKK